MAVVRTSNMCSLKMEDIPEEQLVNSAETEENLTSDTTATNPQVLSLDKPSETNVIKEEGKAPISSDVNLNSQVKSGSGDCPNRNKDNKENLITMEDVGEVKDELNTGDCITKTEDNTENIVKMQDVEESKDELCPKGVALPQDTSTEDNALLGSLSNLLVYESDNSMSESSSEASSSEGSSSEASSSESSSSESESCESMSTDNEQEHEDEVAKNEKKKRIRETIRTFGEMSIDDLPPVPDLSTLKLGLDEKDCMQMGVISGVVDKLVLVEALPNMPAYDLDTLLFLDNGKKPFGYVHDVMGSVLSPVYIIRFNSKQDIENMSVTAGIPIFSAPKSEHTKYVFLQQLMEVKGSDASWTGDNEVPAEHADFSDDEEERRVRRGACKNSGETRKRNSLESHQSFEKDMNVKNVIDTRLHKIRDNFEPSTKRHVSNTEKRGFPFHQNGAPKFRFAQHNLNANVPSFPPVFNVPYMPPGVHLPPFPFMPPMARISPVQSIPFRPNIPPPPMKSIPPSTVESQVPNIPPPPQMQGIPRHMHNIRTPQMQNIPRQMQSMQLPQMPSQVQPVHCSFPNLSVPPPALPADLGRKSPQMRPRMLFPPDMGLPRPPPNFAPRLAYYEQPRPPGTWSYQGTQPNYWGPQNFVQPMRGNFFPKRP